MESNLCTQLRRRRQLIGLLLPLQIFYGIYILVFYHNNGILPAPFYFDATDTFMDFFNTNFWSLQPGRYDEWHSTYPIFVFVFGKLLTPAACANSATPFLLRACDAKAILFIMLCYALGTGLCASFLTSGLTKNTTRFQQGLGWFLILLLAIPGLFALERGNYIILAFLFLALSVFYQKDWKAALFLALAINIKQYLIILWVILLLKRRYDQLLLGVVFAVFFNILGLVLVQDFHYREVFDNMFLFAGTDDFSIFEKIWFPTSLSAWVRAAENMYNKDSIRTSHYIWVSTFLTLGLWTTYGLVAAAFSKAATRARQLSTNYLSFICLCGFIASTDTVGGGYSLLLLFPFLGDLVHRPHGRLISFFVVLACFPLGWGIGPSPHETANVAFLSGRSFLPSSLTLGSFLRPLLIIALLGSIVWDLFATRRHTKTAQTPTDFGFTDTTNLALKDT